MESVHRAKLGAGSSVSQHTGGVTKSDPSDSQGFGVSVEFP